MIESEQSAAKNIESCSIEIHKCDTGCCDHGVDALEKNVDDDFARLEAHVVSGHPPSTGIFRWLKIRKKAMSWSSLIRAPRCRNWSWIWWL